MGNQLDGFRFTLRAFAQQNGWMVEAEFVAGKVQPAVCLAYSVFCMWLLGCSSKEFLAFV